MANSQHRCVFVGNIPYDATEEQLIQICEEVGPVVSFRLVIDRETGKPKGYGFCEYKDEETALSARRNLHGYDINGRQLRVDFAENDKNNEKTREQGRGGPGMSTNIAPQKQIGGPADPTLHQPIGLQDAMAAAIVMAGVLGGGQSQNGIRSQPIPGTDPLTLHLAKMSKSQLTEVLTEVKAMATQNKEQARQLLLAHPQLAKAVLQAHIMLKTVPPPLLQMPNARQLPGPVGPQSSLAQNKVPLGFMPQGQSQPASLVPIPSQYATSSLPPHPRFQTPLPAQHPTLSANLQSLHPQQQPVTLSSQMASSSVVGHSTAQLVASVQPSIPTHSLLQDNVFKPSSSIGPSILNNIDKPQHSLHNPTWPRKLDHHPNMPSRSHENGRFISDNDQILHPQKLLKMEDGKAASFSPPDINHHPPSVLAPSGNQILKAGPTDSQKQNHELPAGVDSALLQQVLNLTPEQLSSLPPDQQQQVIQLQQMLRHST
ncbi:hypothetical protein L2E82_26522 [Cichorium intybus]|uniref:Uncharacterized protein n=1 Tax=Cichorium intybus TaxID=13427 RepID=A0ACB9CRB5_CICIN|nr:hypothetical protein L2E82_26522 [Cichorium intybus]